MDIVADDGLKTVIRTVDLAIGTFAGIVNLFIDDVGVQCQVVPV
jgi:hypothetical protein